MIGTYLSIIVSLFIIEVLLSVDNALVNATLAASLPPKERTRAIRIGIILGAVFRLVALLIVSFIIQNAWLRLLGGLYLMYLAMAHLGRPVDEKGHDVQAKNTFWGIIIQIGIADIVFSIDNVLSAVSFSENLAIVILGVSIGIVSMLFITPILSKLIEIYKRLPNAAYAIVGMIGFFLVLETTTGAHVTEVEKFTVVMAIVVFTIWFEHSLKLRKATRPWLRIMQYFIAIPIDIIYSLRNLLASLIRKL